MRIVDYGQRHAFRRKRFHTTGRRLALFDRCDRVRQWNVVTQQHGERSERVVDIERTDESRRDQSSTPAAIDIDVQSGRCGRYALCEQLSRVGSRRCAGRADGRDRRCMPTLERERTTERVVDIDDGMRKTRPIEQLRLRGAVRFERPVIVEMIMGEIREQRGMEPHSRNAMLIERVRGDFDTDMPHIGVA